MYLSINRTEFLRLSHKKFASVHWSGFLFVKEQNITAYFFTPTYILLNGQHFTGNVAISECTSNSEIEAAVLQGVGNRLGI